MAAFPVSQNFSQSYQNDGFGFSTPSNRSSVDTSSSSGSFDEPQATYSCKPKYFEIMLAVVFLLMPLK